jgi:hypothetical protein
VKLIFFFLFNSIISIGFCQEIKTAVFSNGTEINYQLLSNHAKDIRKLNAWLFDLNTRATLSLGSTIAFSIPEKFLSKFHLGYGDKGIGKISLENTVFFKTKEKTKSSRITLISMSDGNYKTKFKVKEPIIMRNQFGARVGYLKGDFRGDIYQNNNVTTANELSVGVSFVKTKFFKIKNFVNVKPVIGSKMVRTSYYAEMLYYHDVSTNTGKGLNDLGYRIGLDGQIGSRIGFSYSLGLEKPPVKFSYFDVFFGCGIYFAFL